MQLLISYLSVLVPLLILDAIWILGVARKFYADTMGFLFSKSMNLIPAALFYPIYALAVCALAVLPALSAGSWTEALWRGAILGLAAYGAYDLTNHATIDGWPLSMTLVDMVWGTAVTALTSVIAYFIITTLK